MFCSGEKSTVSSFDLIKGKLEDVQPYLLDLVKVAEYHPFMIEGGRAEIIGDQTSGIGSVRRLHYTDGTTFLETIVELDTTDTTTHVKFEMTEFPFHCVEMNAIVDAKQVVNGEYVKVTLTIEYIPKNIIYGAMLKWIMEQKLVGPMLANLKNLVEVAHTTSKKEGRSYLIGGNWKCNGNSESLQSLIKDFNALGPIPKNVEVVICAPSLYIPLVKKSLRSDISVGAQNCGVNESQGAYTGEINADQLLDVGVEWVIIGHSERREGFGMVGEDELLCAKKLKVALDKGLKVIFCIGEKKEDREAGITMDICTKQLAPAADLLNEKDWANVSIAYEPVWAVGTGLTETPEMAQETHASIREWVKEHVSANVANAILIQYGGSMKGSNAKELLAQPDIDGGLIGGASLKADFFNIIHAVP